ncbi:MAG: hypothetical protein K0Q72_4660, partial [Armatimonadetes bacterium]|nr:hypothetical protein [Armatimonadota bacterium]
DPGKAKDFNPYNPLPGSPRYERRLESNKKLFAFLEARASGKDAKLDLPTGRGPGAPGGGASSPRPGAAPGNR